MKKIISLLLAIIITISAMSGVNFSAFATDWKYDVTDYYGSNGGQDNPYSEYCDQFTPNTNEYTIARWANQFDFYENYHTVEVLKNLCREDKFDALNKAPMLGDGTLFDKYTQKLGLNNPALTDFQKIEKIFYFVQYTHRYNGGLYDEGGLICRRGRCEQYSCMVDEFCARCGVECYNVGSSNINHAFNIVKLDGKYYIVDATNGYNLYAPKNYNEEHKKLDFTDYEDISIGSANETYDKQLINEAVETSEYTYWISGWKTWYAQHKNQFANDNYNVAYSKSTAGSYIIPSGNFENKGLDAPEVTTIATDEGYIVKWKAVEGADFYKVHYLEYDGFADSMKLKKDDAEFQSLENCIYNKKYSYSNYHLYTNAVFTFIHSIDINEEGYYQHFVPYDYLTNGKGAIFFVLAYDVNGNVSTHYLDKDVYTDILGAEDKMVQDFTEATYSPWSLTDKSTGELIEGANGTARCNKTVLKIKPEYYVEPQEKANAQHHFKKVKTVRQASVGRQGAEVYECTNCLLRKMKYTPQTAPCTSHKWVLYETKKAEYGKTAAADGYRKYYCSICDKHKTETIYAIKSIKLKNTTVVYNGKVQKPEGLVIDRMGNVVSSKNYKIYIMSVDGCGLYGNKPYSINVAKNVGLYGVDIVLNNSLYDIDKRNSDGVIYGTCLTYRIIKKPSPKKTAISKLVKGNKSFKATWKKASGITGYQIQYATNSKFTKSKKTVTVKGKKNTVKTIKNLKANKKYFVRVRTYKAVNGQKYFSKWSKAKTVKTK